MAKPLDVIKSIFNVCVITNSRPTIQGQDKAKPVSLVSSYIPILHAVEKTSFLHHDYYSNYRCSDKGCNHSFFVVKGTAVKNSFLSVLFGNPNRQLVHKLCPIFDNMHIQLLPTLELSSDK